MRGHIVWAMMLRSFRGTFFDKGRMTELIVFPLSFLVIWGLFFESGMVERELAGQLLVINLIWSIAGTFQTQANLTLMFDLWSREFAHILRQGVRIGEMVLAHLIFATVLGLLNMVVFLFAIVYAFGGGRQEIDLFFELFPLYYIAAIGLAALFGGFVILLGRSYGFIAWTGLQIIIMLSSPFSPLSTLPGWLQFVSRASPFTYVFEFVRTRHSPEYWQGLIISIAYLIVGCICAVMLYKRRRSRQGLMEV